MTQRTKGRKRKLCHSSGSRWHWSNSARVAEPWLREEARAAEIRYREHMAALCEAAAKPEVQRMVTLFPMSKFDAGNAADGKHYWLTPPDLMYQLDAEFAFDFDPCPYPKPEGFDGLTCEWGVSNYVNPPFGAIIGDDGKKKGPTAWARKAIEENSKGKRVVLVYPIYKWMLMLLAAGARVRNLGDVRWHSTEDGLAGKGTGCHIACFILEPPESSSS